MSVAAEAKPVLLALGYTLAFEHSHVVASCFELGIKAAGATADDAVANLNTLVLYQINQW